MDRDDCSLNQHSMASISCPTAGRLPGRQIMAPRPTSMSSLSRRVTAMGGNPSVSGSPPGARISKIVEVMPEGRTVTFSPTRNTPLAIVPA